MVAAPSESGRVLLCPCCARAYSSAAGRVDVAITWAELERQLGRRSVDLHSFRWIRSGVQPAERRTLLELAQSGGRFRAAERSGAALGAVLVLVLSLLLLKAVGL